MDCLTKFFEMEIIFDSYFCEHCKTRGKVILINIIIIIFIIIFKATKSTIITKLPRILTIHLKRFKTAKK